MRHKEVKATSSLEERINFEVVLQRFKSLFNMGLELGISESSLYKYRNGYEQGLKIKNKITNKITNKIKELI